YFTPAQSNNLKFSSFHHQERTTDPKLSSSLHQQSGFVTAKTGDDFTLRCFYEGDVALRFHWYKQTLGQKPRLISTYYKYERNGIFHDEFKNNPRFTLDTETGKYHLKITDLHVSDSATYYCASYSLSIEFAEGTLVNVEGSGLKVAATVHQSASESIQPGGSVTLNCTVHTGTCDGEHSVYWFKKSEESQPGLIYTHGGRNDQCERKPNTQTHTCVYKLPMKSLNLPHAGTYYCAVASCGHILFGNGTKLELEGKVPDLSVSDVRLSTDEMYSPVLVVLLAFLMCMMNNRNRCLCAESQARFSDSSKTKMNASKMQRDDTWSECVYFSVKQ
uniref:Ig-like domain-containing protein n=1 Tax=Sander lucioperca TaxID=283035 RepID=A0A8D0D2S5_SANLU